MWLKAYYNSHFGIKNHVLRGFFHCRYDVELYQRIEQLIGKRLPKFNVVEEEVMMLEERVTEAQRIAKMVSNKTGVGRLV